MRALLLETQSGVEGLRLAEREPVPPGPGEALVRVRTVCANRLDLELFWGRGLGRELRPPRVPGLDPAGEVVEAAAETGLRAGDRVVAKPGIPCGECELCRAGEDADCLRLRVLGVHLDGGAAEQATLPARALHRIPDGLGFDAASALAHSAPVALRALARARVEAGDTVLVIGARGAVGSAAAEAALMRGARVIAAISAPEPEDRRLWRERGAQVVDRDRGLASEVRLLAPAGVSAVLCPGLTPAAWGEVTSVLARRGRIAVFANLGVKPVPLDLGWLNRTRAELVGCSSSGLADFESALKLAAAGGLTPPARELLPLERFREAYAALEAGPTRGRIVFRVS